MGLGYMNYVRYKRVHDPRYKVVAIAQRSADVEILPTAYLAELMELSTDRPSNLYKIKTKDLELKLGRSALIKHAEVTKINPGTVLVDYTLRKPIAFLGDFSNTALDEEGVLVPFKPYFTPKKLPTIYLGLNEDEEGTWGKPLQSTRATLALHLYKLITTQCCGERSQLLRIDVSKAQALSYGQRQIVVIMEERIEKNQGLFVYPRMLRLSTENYRQELANYLILREHLNRAPEETAQTGTVLAPLAIIELRVPHLAFIKQKD